MCEKKKEEPCLRALPSWYYFVGPLGTSGGDLLDHDVLGTTEVARADDDTDSRDDCGDTDDHALLVGDEERLDLAGLLLVGLHCGFSLCG